MCMDKKKIDGTQQMWLDTVTFELKCNLVWGLPKPEKGRQNSSCTLLFTF